ncbi:MAG: hypothetical protein RL120_09140, partial [Gammaproteobacteria bacterium]
MARKKASPKAKKKTPAKKRSAAKAQKKNKRKELSENERASVLSSLQSLPPPWRNDRVAKMLARTMRDEDFAKQLRANPAPFFKKCGVTWPDNVKMEVHAYDEFTAHVILPSPVMSHPRRDKKGKIVITDEDLVSVKLLGFFPDWNSADGTDPKTTDMVRG